MIMESGPQRVRFFVAQDRQADACSHADPFAGRKNMEHDSAECSRAKSSRSQPTRLHLRYGAATAYSNVYNDFRQNL